MAFYALQALPSRASSLMVRTFRSKTRLSDDLAFIHEINNSAKTALTHRLGISHLDGKEIDTIFYKAPQRNQQRVKFQDFNELVHRGTPDVLIDVSNAICLGTCALTWYCMQYIQKRWPQLDVMARRIAMTMYTAPGNLARLAKSLGMSITLDGLPKNLGPIRARVKGGVRMHRSMDDILNRKVHNKKECLKHANTLLAVIGALQRRGEERGFLDNFVLSAYFDGKKLVKPIYPIVNLTKLLRQQGGLERDGNVTFRLGKETGRQSGESMYMVGVFTSQEGREPIGEGN
jgi:hypothetical protein